MDTYKTPYKYYKYLCELLDLSPLSQRYIKVTTYNNNELLYYGGNNKDKYYSSIKFFRSVRYNDILDMYYTLASRIGYNNLTTQMNIKESLNCKIEKRKYSDTNFSLLTIISVLYLHEIDSNEIFERSIEYIFKSK